MSAPPPLKAKPRFEETRPPWSDVAEGFLIKAKEYVPRPRHVDPVTLWANELLESTGKSIKYIDEDLRDGVVFITLIELRSEFRFADNHMPWYREPDSGAEKMANLRFTFQHLTSLGIDMAGDRHDMVMMDEQMAYRTLFRIAKHYELGDPTFINFKEEQEIRAAPPPREKLDVIPVAEREINVAGFVMIKAFFDGGEEKLVQVPLRSSVGVATYIIGAAFERIVSDLSLYDVSTVDGKGKRVKVKLDKTLEELGMLNGSMLYIVGSVREEPTRMELRALIGTESKPIAVFASDTVLLATFKVWEQVGDRSTGFAGYGLKAMNKVLPALKSLAQVGVNAGDAVAYVVTDEDMAATAAASSGQKRVSEETHYFLRVLLEETGQAKTIAFDREQTVTATMNEIGVKFEILNVSDYFLRHEKKGILKPQKTMVSYKFEQREQVVMCLQKGKVREAGVAEFNVDAILPPEWNEILARAGIDKSKLRSRRETMQIRDFLASQYPDGVPPEGAEPDGAEASPAPKRVVKVVKRDSGVPAGAAAIAAASPPTPGESGSAAAAPRVTVIRKTSSPAPAASPPPAASPAPAAAPAGPTTGAKPKTVVVRKAGPPAVGAKPGPPALAPKPMTAAEQTRVAAALATYTATLPTQEVDAWGGSYGPDGTYYDADGGATDPEGGYTDAAGEYWPPGSY